MDLQTSHQSQALEKLQINPGEIELVFARLAEVALGAGIALIPFRAGIILQARPLPPLYPGYTNLVLYPADLFMLSALIFWTISLIIKPRKISLTPLWITLPLAGLTSAAAVSIFFSADRVFSAFQTLRMIGLFWLSVYILNEIRSLRVVAWGAGVGLAFQAVVGIAQVLRQHSLGLTSLHELVLDPSQSGVSIVWSTGLRSLRAYGLTDHPNILGGCLSLALILLVALYLKSGGQLKIILSGLAALGLLALFLTFSRSAWLGFAGGLVLLVAWLASRRRWSDLAAGSALAVVCLLVLLPFLWQDSGLVGIRLGANGSFTADTTENQSLNERGLLANHAVSLFAAHPLTGVGVGAFPQALHRAVPNYPFNLQPPHIVALDIAAETGAAGAVFYLLLQVAPWAMLLAARRRLHFSIELAAVSAALLGISLISLFDYYPWMSGPGQYWQWLLWGLWGAMFIQSTREPAYD